MTMSSGWHWYVAAITLINIIACIWLILWSSRQGDAAKANSDTLDHTWDEDLCERNNPLPRWWLYLFVGTIIWGLGYLVYYPGLGAYPGVGGWSQKGQYQAERARIDAVYQEKFASLAALDYKALSQHADGMDIAGRLYGANCATCHGSDARGAVGFPNLTDNDWLYGDSPQVLTHSITLGRQGLMPGWAAALGGDEGVRQTMEYVKSLSGMDHDAAMAGEGQARYNTVCIACHGATGTGMQALGAPNLTDGIWLYGNSDDALYETIAVGRNGVMPAHQTLLSEEEIKLLVAYVMSLGGGETNATGAP
ncbi:MAG: cytochrome-c oxidase, cbb3-type subunit III [Pseudomonadota bacterium]